MKRNLSKGAGFRSSSVSVLKLVRSYALAIAALALCDRTLLAQGVLADPGFESGGPVAGGIGGWDIYSGSPVFTQSFVRSGIWALQANYAFGMDASLVDQWLAVQPGSQYTLTGWAITPVRLATSRVGYFYLRFFDANHVPIGQGNRSGTISSISPVNSWVPLSLTATAPPGAAYVQISAGVGLPQFQVPETNAVYFDDLSLALVPEPSSQALLVAAFSGWLWLRSRKGGRHARFVGK